MKDYNVACLSHFKTTYSQQLSLAQEVWTSLLNLQEFDSPEYLTVNNIYKSHLIRQKLAVERLPKIFENAAYTLKEIINGVGAEKITGLTENGLFPREPSSSFSYFSSALTKSLNAPKSLGFYITMLRSTIGCCDDFIDKDRYYLVYGKSTDLVSHFMLDLGEILMVKEGLFSENFAKKIGELNKKMIMKMHRGESELDLFNISYPQGYTFVKIVGLFSDKNPEFVNNLAKAAGYYDFGGHILGEIVDYHIDKENYLRRENLTPDSAFKKAMGLYEKSISLCPKCSFKNFVKSEKSLFEELWNTPGALEHLVSRRKKEKTVCPETAIMKLKKQNAGAGI